MQEDPIVRIGEPKIYCVAAFPSYSFTSSRYLFVPLIIPYPLLSLSWNDGEPAQGADGAQWPQVYAASGSVYQQ